MPQNRLKRSAVSSERFTAVALVIFTTTGIKLYRPYMQSTNARKSPPVEKHSAAYQCSQIKTLFIPERFTRFESDWLRKRRQVRVQPSLAGIE